MPVSAALQPDTVTRLMANFRNGDHETAGTGTATVARYWSFARNWLKKLW